MHASCMLNVQTRNIPLYRWLPVYSVPLINQVHCCPVEELLSSDLLHSILESLVYSLEAELLLARSSLLGYLGFYQVQTIMSLTSFFPWLSTERLLIRTCRICKVKEGTVWFTTNLKIRKSWSISESPWNNGFFVTISANIHPTLQMSTGQAYLWHPKRTSGARYHRVTT